MKRQGGFTLIELVVVIVILGILAVTAAPRFLNLQGDARESALQGLKGAMDGAAGITYGKAAIEGKDKVTTSTPLTGSGITVLYGYPDASATGIIKAVSGLTTDWAYGIDNGKVVVSFPTSTLKVNNDNSTSVATSSSCYVTYTPATSTTEASTALTISASGC
ncbi:type II secretion system protein [Vibrio diazotrophicus]|uniref:type II secretion system protein n=1 Tax=Vibrio diazotrophicus TaxID=685 RepID=UPI000C9DBC93|nr:type II secretion system protein [Vibrio diazotrophicus]PNH77851.1 MSHA biogenesis protein MshA [Vibrio diazotrophicus]